MRSLLLSTLNTCMPFIEYTWIYIIFLVLSFLVWADGKERWFPRGWKWKRAGETLRSVHMNPTGWFNCLRAPLLTPMLLIGTHSAPAGTGVQETRRLETSTRSSCVEWQQCVMKPFVGGKIPSLCLKNLVNHEHIFERVSHFLCILTWLQCFSKSSQIIKIYIHKCSKNNSSQK